MKKILFRIIHFSEKIIMKIWRWPKYQIIKGADSLNTLPNLLKEKKFIKAFIITGPNIYKSGLCDKLESEFEKQNIEYDIYTNVINNPTTTSIEAAAGAFRESNADVLIGIGGGSVLDTTKLVGALYSNPKSSLKKMRGYFKIQHPTPYMCLVPTTAGSGSEATIVAVVTNDKTHEKYAIGSLKLLPQIIVLDPVLLLNVPPKVMAHTGMDALAHALECYIGKANNKQTKKQSLEAIQKIWSNLEKSYNNSQDIKAKEQMLLASFLAGEAFTRGFVGYVHALSHPISGIYNLPHGLVNAVLLPVVLKSYGESIEKDMKKLYLALGYQTKQANYTLFIIEEIKKNNNRLGIPSKLKISISDYDRLINHALKEAHPLYPVPRILSKKELEYIYKEISNSVDF